MLRVIGAVQGIRILYAVEIRSVGRPYMHRHQYIRAFGLLFNSLPKYDPPGGDHPLEA